MRQWFFGFVTFCMGILASTGVGLAAPPEISSLSETVLPPSGRLLIFGSGFGDDPEEGEVLIDDLSAIVTQWMDDEIHAYVPEAASIGPVSVLVESPEGVSGSVAVEVTPRESGDRVAWHFEMDHWDTRQFTTVAQDGTIYSSDRLGLYALSPDGGLLWFVAGVGDGRPIAISPDGTIYVAAVDGQGTDGNILALNSDGSVRWEFDAPSFFLDLVTGPSLGPDGNVYAYQDLLASEGLGFFSLTPEGALRWSDRGDPELSPLSDISNSEIVFAGDRFYSGMVNIGSGEPVTYAFDLGGDQLWFTGNSDLDVFFHSFPTTDPRRRAIGIWGQTGLIALDPSGQTEWITVHPSQINVEDLPTVDSVGNIYAGASRGEMWSLTPDGAIRWVLPNRAPAMLSKVGISPDDAVLVAHLARPGRVTVITGHDPADGSNRWRVVLPNIGGLTQLVTSQRPAFSPNAEIAYVTTSSGGPSVDYSRLYALRVH